MSDNEEVATEEKVFCVDLAKQGRASCKICKEKCAKGELRIGKLVPNPFGSGKMKSWHHLDCIFEKFLTQRPSTKRIQSSDDLDGWYDLNEADQEDILKRINEVEKTLSEKTGIKGISPKKPSPTSSNKRLSKKNSPARRYSCVSDSGSSNLSKAKTSDEKRAGKDAVHNDLLFREFRKLVDDLSNVNGYLDKTGLIKKIFSKGSDEKGFRGNVLQWCRLLLPGVVKRIYNLQNKQLIKLFSRIFHVDSDTMLEHSKQGDVTVTIYKFFRENKKVPSLKNSILTVQEVDEFLEELSKLTKEDEQVSHLKPFIAKCTADDLKLVVRLITHDIKINAGAKHVLEAVHPDAYEAYKTSMNLEAVVERCLKNKEGSSRVKASVSVMTPIQPMLAEACKSVEYAMKKCPNGIFAEIKYDGERVQVHKHGNDFKYFTRNLKPVLSHKVSHFKDYIPKAFPHAKDLILDGEILMIDTNTGKPLPFGTLGVHKKSEFKDANVCLFVFDCLYFNGESLLEKPIERRKKILQESMIEIPNRIMFSEMEIITKSKELSLMTARILGMGLEGLVLKDLKSIYLPGKRRWLKVKKDYLLDGAMADTADLIVLGAWYGTGKKGGMMSVFLMGSYDPNTKRFCTVTKVHTGHDDNTLEKLQDELKMIYIGADADKIPSWLHCTKTMIPDFVAENPKKQPVWEITGAEFTQHEVHTANGISIRFPRVTRIRDDKTWKTATNVEELKVLFTNSKENIDVSLLMNANDNEESGSSIGNNEKSPKSKQKKQEEVNNKNEKKVKRKHSTSHSKDETTPPKKAKTEKESKREKKDEKKTENKNNNIDYSNKIKDPLPNIFDNVKLLVANKGQEEFGKWLRYFTAYGGIIIKPEDCENATHVLHLEDHVNELARVCPTSAKHVIVQWIEDSVANNNLQEFRPYTVLWKSQTSL